MRERFEEDIKRYRENQYNNEDEDEAETESDNNFLPFMRERFEKDIKSYGQYKNFEQEDDDVKRYKEKISKYKKEKESMKHNKYDDDDKYLNTRRINGKLHLDSDKTKSLLNIIHGDINTINCDTIISIIDDLNNNVYDIFDTDEYTFNKNITISDICILNSKLMMRTICKPNKTIDEKILELALKYETPLLLIFVPIDTNSMLESIIKSYEKNNTFTQMDVHIIIEYLEYFYPEYILFNTAKTLLKYIDDNDNKFKFDIYKNNSTDISKIGIPLFKVNTNIFTNTSITPSNSKKEDDYYYVCLNLTNNEETLIISLYNMFDKNEEDDYNKELANIKVINV